MATYTIGSGSRVETRARSSIHDTTTRWETVSGTVVADPETLAEAGATATIAVDMTAFDAGDWLKNRKLKKDLDVASHPRAEFELTGLSDVVRATDGSFTATATGTLRWRGREAAITASGTGRFEGKRMEATARFELDVTTLGVKPPKILMFKVEDVVSVEVTVVGSA